MSKKSRIARLTKSLLAEGVAPGRVTKRETIDGVDIPQTAGLNRIRSRTLRRAMARQETGFGPWTREQARVNARRPITRARLEKHNQRNSHNGWARRAIEKAKKEAEAATSNQNEKNPTAGPADSGV